MWQANAKSESNGRIIKITFSQSDLQLSFFDVLTLLSGSTDFRSYFSAQLSSVPFSAFRWETPSVTTTSIDRYFECVLVDDPGLERTPDIAAFSDYFTSGAVKNVAVFPNLGNDAILVVPCPVTNDSSYGHIAAFLRNAPGYQRDALWKSVGLAMLMRLSSKPVWPAQRVEGLHGYMCG